MRRSIFLSIQNNGQTVTAAHFLFTGYDSLIRGSSPVSYFITDIPWKCRLLSTVVLNRRTRSVFIHTGPAPPDGSPVTFYHQLLYVYGSRTDLLAGQRLATAFVDSLDVLWAGFLSLAFRQSGDQTGKGGHGSHSPKLTTGIKVGTDLKTKPALKAL